MSNSNPIWMALGVNAGVAGITYAVCGWSAAGAHAAARNTARFSALWFIVAFAAPKLMQWIRNLPSEVQLVRSFFAAHAVHFATVGLLLWRFETAHIYEEPVRAAAIILFHKSALYVVFLIFFLAFVHKLLHNCCTLDFPLKLLHGVLHVLTGSLDVEPLRRRDVLVVKDRLISAECSVVQLSVWACALQPEGTVQAICPCTLRG